MWSTGVLLFYLLSGQVIGHLLGPIIRLMTRFMYAAVDHSQESDPRIQL